MEQVVRYTAVLVKAVCSPLQNGRIINERPVQTA
jgi:hypothetical protein